MTPEPKSRLWPRVAVVVLVGWLLLDVIALEQVQLVRALAAFALILLPPYLIAWPALRPAFGSARAFVISGGFAFGTIVISGLVLNVLPWAIQQAAWLGYVVALVTVALLAHRPRLTWHPRFTVARHELILWATGGALMATAMLFAVAFADSPAESFTQMWIRSDDVSQPTPGVEVTIRSHEQQETVYRLVVSRDGVQVESWSEIRLAPGDTWDRHVTTGQGHVRAALYLAANPHRVYRYVTLYVGSPGAPTATGQ